MYKNDKTIYPAVNSLTADLHAFLFANKFFSFSVSPLVTSRAKLCTYVVHCNLGLPTARLPNHLLRLKVPSSKVIFLNKLSSFCLAIFPISCNCLACNFVDNKTVPISFRTYALEIREMYECGMPNIWRKH